MSVKDGGPAFPTIYISGMTLRDYFASAVVASLGEDNHGAYVGVHNNRAIGTSNERAEREASSIAQAAYMIADAMLKERAK